MNNTIRYQVIKQHIINLIKRVEPDLIPYSKSSGKMWITQGFYYAVDKHETHIDVNNAFVEIFKENGYETKLEYGQGYTDDVKDRRGRIDAFATKGNVMCAWEFDTGITPKYKSIEKVINLYKQNTDKKFYGFLAVRGSSKVSKEDFAETVAKINKFAKVDFPLYIVYLSTNYIARYQRVRTPCEKQGEAKNG